MALMALSLLSCSQEKSHVDGPAGPEILSLEDVAKIFSELPLQSEHLDEVYDAVSSSTTNGYDEEYMMSDLLTSPGAGVGEDSKVTKSKSYTRPLKDLLSEHFARSTRAGDAGYNPQVYMDALEKSGFQIYWPYSEEWDGQSYPIITFDPGLGAESNVGYEIRVDKQGVRVVNTVLVTEEVALSRPVWVINRNSDSSFTPLDIFADLPPGLGGDEPVSPDALEMTAEDAPAQIEATDDTAEKPHLLSIKAFKALRNYDSWFAGGSEFFVKCGAVDRFKATTDEDLKKYTPSVSDFMIVVKRKEVGKWLPLDAILLTDLTSQMEKIAFMISEDDGGTTTSWKCEAVVKLNSKSWGLSLDIPYKNRDDIVWRGQLTRNFFKEGKTVTGRFGDVVLIFELQ